jgi:hypothetical protein
MGTAVISLAIWSRAQCRRYSMKLISRTFTFIKVGILAIVGLIALVFVSLGLVHHFSTQPPSVSKADWTVQTSSLFYLTNDVKQSDNGTVITLNSYYTLQGDKYVYHSGTLVLNEKYYGVITVSPRN